MGETLIPLPSDRLENKYTFEDLIEITKILRSELGCPWDREQTHETLKNCLVEECYEVVEAINNKDKDNLCEELGDILLQVALHSVIANEQETFTINDITDCICKKMIHRHPHVFSNIVVGSSEDVVKNWEDIKREEKKQKSQARSMEDIARALPANIRATKVQKKASQVGFDFSDFADSLSKVYEELEELKDAQKSGEKGRIEEEFGDLMFSVVNVSRLLHLNAENSLTNATDKFINRFVSVENIASSAGQQLNDLSVEELNALWERVK